MLELTSLHIGALLTMFIELALYTAARKLALDLWKYRALGIASLVVGVPVLGWLAFSAGQFAWHSAWRAAAEHLLLLYVVGTATWLGWRESKSF